MRMQDWHVAGQQVVCIDDRPHVTCDEIAARLRLKRIYTIREVTCDGPDSIGFLLVEVINPRDQFVTGNGAEEVEPSYAATRFRPVRPTSIETLRSLLSPMPERVDVLEDA